MNDASAWEGTTLLSFVRSVHAGTEESRSRSDILKPLVWPLGLSLAATTALGTATAWGAPVWMPIAAGILAGAFAALYISGYVYFGLRQPDALRSENYTLRKMAIERGLRGDSSNGLEADVQVVSGMPTSNAGRVLSDRSGEA